MNTLNPAYQQALGKSFTSLTDICHLSFDELRQKVRGELSWSQTVSLYLDAKQVQKDNLLHEARILKRANPQLQNAIQLTLTKPHADQQGYNSKFGNRASQYAAPDSISSMFSPAAYLTELYRQARDLHTSDSIYHLDTRRPDLQLLTLSQKNMDTEISTLSLSNNVLLESIISNQSGRSHYAEIMEKLSTFPFAGSLPYHDAYESVRKIIQLQAPVFEQSSTPPKTTVAKLMYQISLLEINSSVSPELFNILTEEITEANAKSLYNKNFGNINPSLIENPEYLRNYYNLTDEEFSHLTKLNVTLTTKKIKSTTPSNAKYDYLLLLKRNKFIRLSKATNLPLPVLVEIISNTNPGLNINAEVLKKVFRVKYYMHRYGIDTETALILCKAPISQRDDNNSPSQFDRLFNTPKLNGQDFSAENKEIDLNPNNTNDWKKTALKRAFNVDDVSLYRLLKIVNGGSTTRKIIHNIENLSHLYLTKLLADIHQLTINELGLLLIATGEGKTNLLKITDNELVLLINKLYDITEWLRTQKLSVYQLFIMTTNNYDKTLIPEIYNLLDTVYNGLKDFDKKAKKTKKNLLEAISPYITAALQLPSEHTAYAILTWADKLEPGKGKMTAEKLWSWLRVNPVTTQPEFQQQAEPVIQYCQCLAQLALIYRSTGLNENAFHLFVTKPQIFGTTAETESTPNALSLIMMTHFADWINSLGKKASFVLTELEKGTLTAKQLASAMNLDKNLLLQASTLEQKHNPLISLTTNEIQPSNPFISWASIDAILQWVDIARQLHVSPENASELAELLTNDLSAAYNKWENIATALTAGLDTPKANTLHAFLDESRSTALSEYYIRNITNKGPAIKNRDDLYQYLLIDNQVSAAIKTTRIAEAIASIQLYINQALKNIEENTVQNVTSRQFFADWDKYNKRYSTWASVSKLAYYPENYIDPTMRIGQTKMMDTLLQSVSQSQLNTDTVEDAFNSYLTSFEQVANLEIVSAYHDNINSDQGLTYFIGHSKTEVNQYYWRSVDHNKFSNGKFAANAWSEWYKIDCPIHPYQNTIRPVVYQSRLYITWLEQKKIAKQEKNGQKTIQEYYYELKLAHIRYDGTWNTPITFDVNSKISDLKLANKALGFYCAGYQGEDTLLVMFYGKENKLDNYKNASMQGLYIFSDMSSKSMPITQITSYRDNSYKHFDTNSIIRVNNRYAEKYEIPSSINNNKGYNWEEHYLGMVYGGNISAISLESQSDNLKIKISPKLRVIHNGYEGQKRNQCNLMKKYGKLGDKFIIYNNLGVNPDHSTKKQLFYPIYQYSGNASKLDKGRLLFHRDTNYSSKVEAWIPDARRTLSKDNATIGDDYVTDPQNQPNDLNKYLFMIDNMGIATDVSGPININTAISSTKVQVTVNAGSKIQTFTADKQVSTQPSPNFEEMIYQFNSLEIEGSGLNFINNSASIDITFTAFAEPFAEGENDRKLGEEHFSITVTRKVSTDNDVLTLNHDANGAQYIQWGIYRTRLNTLFARKLISRATAGIDTILSMDTQNIQESQLGKGFYATFVIPPYSPSIHGNERWFKLYLKHVVDNNSHIIYSGQLGDTRANITLFIPLDDAPLNRDFHAKVYMTFQKSLSDSSWGGPHFVRDANGVVTISPSSILTHFESVNVLKDVKNEPMDFSGANSLYFWELFYYTPMLIAQRLLHEQNFDEANRWLKYVWNSSGYIVNGQIQNYRWNVRPLQEDTSWNDDPLDSVDPDAVAQHDPMHYKVATFMRTLDLLIAHGDYAYRQLERDTLNEAKMWYMQALHLLGDKPHLSLNSVWSEPDLKDTADIERQKAHSRSMVALRQGQSTTDTQTDLFLPQVNEVMLSYWQTLEQRLYNLRHNLSIDGQPLHLPIYATPADPKALLSATVASSQAGGVLPQPFISLWRFPRMLENARSMVSQLTQFGSTLQNIIERQDAEALNTLLQNQAAELILTNLSIQDKTIEELDAEKTVLEKNRAGAQSRFDSYSKLFDENINAGEKQAMTLRASIAGLSTALQASHLAGAALDLAPNIFGLADGGSHWGAIAQATGNVMEFSASVMNTEADKISQSEAYRRRRQEWEIQRNNAETELKQIDAQLNSLTIRREATVLQKTSLQTQQEQTQAQLVFLQRKFSNQALYNWLRGRLAAIYFQFYDLAVTRCLMAEMAYCWETNNASVRFIKPGAWQGTHAGLLAGEALMLNLAQMEDAHLKQEQRVLEIERTVSLAELYKNKGRFSLSEKIAELVRRGSGNAGNGNNTLKFGTGNARNSLQASISLADLQIRDDYPTDSGVGNIRRIKQLSVTLPALLGPYQDVQAILSYGGNVTGLAESCKSLAVSHGMNDSGQFQLDFNDGKFLPFEGIPIDNGTLTLSFPNATGKQKVMLESLNDIILHIRYTIRQ
ncbi:neuraminidase-like domain-containing protein [Photorhabdus heterorhabditis]|uniref:Toxin n=1 Tax=Photorhabdus heterorhabditis TaxID=880156 RepID=A0A5B0WKZ0_9GAMM|nr:neuraminidase-like domain-containing protein [Photorhabdus heterorhabditis]KAA1187623.1 toxin [Photorhabdus heterorhabditis]